jgi:hypothetical protein
MAQREIAYAYVMHKRGAVPPTHTGRGYGENPHIVRRMKVVVIQKLIARQQ